MEDEAKHIQQASKRVQPRCEEATRRSTWRVRGGGCEEEVEVEGKKDEGGGARRRTAGRPTRERRREEGCARRHKESR